jgi:arylsulfatase A-like enzyme
MKIKRRDFIKITGMSALSAATLPKLSECAELTPADTPNLLFVYPDQHRRQSMGFWSKPEYNNALNGTSDPVITPTLDELAADGIVFTQAMSTHPFCSPFRGMLLSGMFPEQNGIKRNCAAGRNEELGHDIECITDVLSDCGYNTAYFGKAHWHKTVPHFDADGNYVGTASSPGGNYMNSFDTYIPPGPSRHSMEYWYQSVKDSHKNPYIYSNDSVTINGKEDGELHLPKIYSPLNEADHIMNYINNTHNQRDTSKPFCVFWALNPPHSPYSSTNHCDEDAFNTYYKDKNPSELQNRPNVTTSKGSGNVKYYFANVTGVDKQIGRVLSAIEAAGQTDNTIVVFTSDHGEMMGSHDLMSKNIEYEESFGVPLLIKYPQKLKHRIENVLIGTTDLMPTLLSLMGFKDKIPNSVEGTDFSSLLLDPNSSTVIKPDSTPYLNDNDKKKGIRTNKYTFTYSNEGKIVSLFNNIEDPYQLTNISFDSIPEEDKLFLRTQLGLCLAKANDKWYQENKFSDFIIYPQTPINSSDKKADYSSLKLKSFPNPFISNTTISFSLKKDSNVSLNIYNSAGRHVKTVVNNFFNKGYNEVRWNGRNEKNVKVPAGLYIYEFKSENVTKRRKIRLLR